MKKISPWTCHGAPLCHSEEFILSLSKDERRRISFLKVAWKDEILRGVYTERSECAQNDQWRYTAASAEG